jgi:hypothetical protein
MTQGPEGENPQPPSKDGKKKEQKVAKTLLEIDVEKIAKLAEQASKEQTVQDQANKDESGKQPKGKDKSAKSNRDNKKGNVAKTLLEVDLRSLDKLGASLLEGELSPESSQELSPESSPEPGPAPAATDPATPAAQPAPQVQAPAPEAPTAEPPAAPAAETAPPAEAAAPRTTKQPRRLKRLSRTLLEFPMDDLGANRLTGEPESDCSDAPGAADNSFVSPIIGGPIGQSQTQSHTLPATQAQNLNGDLAQTQQAGQAGTGSGSVPAPKLSGGNGTRGIERPKRRTQHFVAKTMLDHSVLFATVAKSKAKMEARVVEKIKERLLEPAKPFTPIVCNRKATLCAFKWDDPEPHEKFRICTLCQTPVYNFNDIELPEAEAIIFQRENIKNPVLFKREDGKYMTRDCPREAMRRQQQFMMILVAVTVVAAVMTLLIMFPPPPPPKPAAEPPQERTPRVVKRTHKPSSVTNKNGTFHYKAGEPIQEIPAAGGSTGNATVNGAGTSTATGTGAATEGAATGGAFATFPEPTKSTTGSSATPTEESGEMWQYADGQGPNQGNNSR